MNNVCKAFLVFLTCPFILYPHSPDIWFEQITIENGLSNNIVVCILQDRRGFMWFGTSDGLNRYDGYTFKIFTHDANDSNSISDNNIWSLHEDSSGHLWIGTNYGLNKYNPQTEKFTHYLNDEKDPNSISNNIETTIFEDQEGNIWMGTENGLNRYNRHSDNFTRFFFPGQLDTVSFWWNNNTIRAINEDKNGKLLLGTTNDLLIFDPQTGETITIPYVIPGRKRWPSVTAIFKDRLGKFWIGIADDGLIEYDTETGKSQLYQTKVNDPYSFSSLFSNCFCEDSKDRLWIGTADQGVSIYDRNNRRFIHYKPGSKYENSFKGRYVWAIYEDNQGNIWIGTDGSGIQLVRKWKKPFRHYVHDPLDINSLARGEVTGFLEDKDGLLWITHFLGGISLFNQKSGNFSHLKHDPQNHASMSRGGLFGICEDSFGDIWLAITPYLDKLDRKTGNFRHYRYDSSNPKSHADTFTLCCYEDRQGNMWFGTSNAGLERLNRADESFDRFCHDVTDSTSISDNCVITLYQDRGGDFWIGTDAGLCRLLYDTSGKEKFIRYQLNTANTESISGKVIMSILEDRSGRLWIGTEAGLNLFDQENQCFKTFNINDGLPSNLVYGIIEDDDGMAKAKAGNLWLRTPRGLVKFDPEKGSFRVYDERDGLKYCKSVGAGLAAFYKGKGGEIYSGGANCVDIFHPDSLHDNPDPPIVVLTDFKINYTSVKIESGSPLTKSITETESVKLFYHQNFISFEFAALDFTMPAKNQYAYKLEGVNPDWVYADASERIATYTNLDPGEYVFYVKGSNSDGVWNENGISRRIIITPPFWKTAWFKLLIVLITAGLIYLMYRYRLKRVLELERMRTQIASDLHDDIGSTLTRIAVYSEIIQTTDVRTKMTEVSRKIGDMSREIITTLSDIVWSIDSRNDTVGELTDRMRDFLDTVVPAGSIQIDFHTRGLNFQKKINPILRQNIYLIFKEAVHNAAKHAQATRICINLTNGDKNFHMEIADNGIGFDVNHKRPGHKGLVNMQSRALKIGGKLTVDTLKGTRVVLIVNSI